MKLKFGLTLFVYEDVRYVICSNCCFLKSQNLQVFTKLIKMLQSYIFIHNIV